MIIDTHTHLDGPEFKDDIQDVVQELKGVGVIKSICARNRLKVL